MSDQSKFTDHSRGKECSMGSSIVLCVLICNVNCTILLSNYVIYILKLMKLKVQLLAIHVLSRFNLF